MNAARAVCVRAAKSVLGKKPVAESCCARVSGVRWRSTEVPDAGKGVTRTTRGVGHPATTSKEPVGVKKEACGDPVVDDIATLPPQLLTAPPPPPLINPTRPSPPASNAAGGDAEPAPLKAANADMETARWQR
jgi:hypothetical protein